MMTNSEIVAWRDQLKTRIETENLRASQKRDLKFIVAVLDKVLEEY